MEKYCQNCRQSNPADATFCRHCASPLPPSGFGGAAAGQYGNQQQWNAPPNQMGGNFATPQTNKASGRAVAAACLAVGGFCCGIFTAIPGAILGWMEISAIKEGRSSPNGMWMAQVGLWGGIVMTVLSVLGSLLYFVLLIAGGGR